MFWTFKSLSDISNNGRTFILHDSFTKCQARGEFSRHGEGRHVTVQTENEPMVSDYGFSAPDTFTLPEGIDSGLRQNKPG